MNALDFLRVIVTAKRNFYQSIPTLEAGSTALIYDDIIRLINEAEKSLPINMSPINIAPVPNGPISVGYDLSKFSGPVGSGGTGGS